MTLADEDTNSIQTDDANKAIQGNVAMQVAPPGGQICNWCKKPYLLVKFATYVSGATTREKKNQKSAKKYQKEKHCQRHNGPRVLSL